jgi:hypothetical protein
VERRELAYKQLSFAWKRVFGATVLVGPKGQSLACKFRQGSPDPCAIPTKHVDECSNRQGGNDG